MTDQFTTLYALNVKDGDVVVSIAGDDYTIGSPHKVSDLKAGAKIWRIVSRASDTPTIWANMTPEEKGALLLAAFEGKSIEMFADGPWQVCTPAWRDDRAYRIKPEPKRETVKRSLHGAKFMGYVAIDMVDDAPQWDTMRPWDDSMERLT